jgi:glutamyl/glutaminyl-tRNA synthetase
MNLLQELKILTYNLTVINENIQPEAKKYIDDLIKQYNIKDSKVIESMYDYGNSYYKFGSSLIGKTIGLIQNNYYHIEKFLELKNKTKFTDDDIDLINKMIQFKDGLSVTRPNLLRLLDSNQINQYISKTKLFSNKDNIYELLNFLDDNIIQQNNILRQKIIQTQPIKSVDDINKIVKTLPEEIQQDSIWYSKGTTPEQIEHYVKKTKDEFGVKIAIMVSIALTSIFVGIGVYRKFIKKPNHLNNKYKGNSESSNLLYNLKNLTHNKNK